jgi:putative nucleotidyltransferase with HDIG domain
MAQSARDKILAISDLYTLPQTLIEVLRATESPDASAHDLSRIILHDAPITARLLRMANSAIYGRSGQVNTVQQAVVLLGFRAVKSVVLSTSVYDIFAKDAERSALNLTEFWRHSLETAATAQLFAAKIGYQPQEEAFVAGLLHDVGLMLMARVFGPDYADLVSRASGFEDWTEAEREAFGIDHSEAGTIFFTAWSLPEKLIDVIGHHHDILVGPSGPTGSKLTLLVSLADRIGHHGLEKHTALTRGQIEEKHNILATLGLGPVDLKNVDAWVAENLSSIASHLDIEIGSPLEILSHANQRLHELFLEMESLLISTPSPKREDLARELLDAICATFSHHINNATTTILGHSQLVQIAAQRGKISDPEGRLASSMATIQNAVAVISAVLNELKSMTCIDIVPYHDRANILDIDDRVKQRVTQQRL